MFVISREVACQKIIKSVDLCLNRMKRQNSCRKKGNMYSNIIIYRGKLKIDDTIYNSVTNFDEKSGISS